MRNILILSVVSLIYSDALGQLNCELFKKDPDCYEACKLYNQESMHQQGSYLSQKHLSEAITLCPTLAAAYYEKSVAFLKRGKFITWKKLVDRAVEINPERHLADRAWAQFAFLHNYKATIEDLERLKLIKDSAFIGVGQNGDYDLRIVLALSYKHTGQIKKAIQIIEDAMTDKDFYVGLYDHLHLGVLYLENKQTKDAILAFKNQIEENELAEAYYYLAKTHLIKKQLKEAGYFANKALELYKKNQKMFSRYYQFQDEIYEQDIIDLQQGMN